MAKSRKKKQALKRNLKFELYGILILLFSVIALSGEGMVARSLTYMFRFIMGSWGAIIPVYFIYVAWYIMIKRQWPSFWVAKNLGFLLILSGILIMSHISLFEQLYPNGSYDASIIIHQTWANLSLAIQPSGFQVLMHQVGGGMVGAFLYAALYYLFNNLGAQLIQYASFAIGFVLLTGISYTELFKKMKKSLQLYIKGWKARWNQSSKKRSSNNSTSTKQRSRKKSSSPVFLPVEEEFDEENYRPKRMPKNKAPFFSFSSNQQNEDDLEDDVNPLLTAPPEGPPYTEEVVQFKDQPLDDAIPIPLIRDFQEHEDEGQISMGEIVKNKSKSIEQEAEGKDESPFLDNTSVTVTSDYRMPSFSLLTKPASQGKGGQHPDFKANAKKLETTLESFGVRAKVLEVVRGPSVTRYEIQPDVGVKVSRIVSLTDDIALALAAKDIRMEAPIPGKSAIGIEVPNSEVSIVTLREVMESSIFHESTSKVTIALGRDISGQPIIGNLAKMPHMLVAGATGSGKSVCINGIITSILFKAKPDEVKFLMIDPKMVELNVYNGIPHLLAPVVTDPKRASLALKKIVSEMEKRYEMFSESGTRNIEGYNGMMLEKGADQASLLPYIVVIVDELADLMMVAAHDVEDAICRLAQMARAAGIHLIIATQRPSVDVITGVIKANIPSRIAFGVSSNVDSRTILDMAGAEKLLGRGDMLFLPVGLSKPIRVQGAFLSDGEVESVVDFARSQEKANYQEDIVPEVEETSNGPETFVDELFDQAVQIVVDNKQASVSLLQRRMRIGYTRAARLIDTMEAKGIVGPYEGSKPRTVLVSAEQIQNNDNKISS